MYILKVDLLKLFVVTDTPLGNVFKCRGEYYFLKVFASVEGSVLDLFNTLGDYDLLYILIVCESDAVDRRNTLLCRDLDDAVLVSASCIGLKVDALNIEFLSDFCLGR